MDGSVSAIVLRVITRGARQAVKDLNDVGNAARGIRGSHMGGLGGVNRFKNVSGMVGPSFGKNPMPWSPGAAAQHAGQVGGALMGKVAAPAAGAAGGVAAALGPLLVVLLLFLPVIGAISQHFEEFQQIIAPLMHVFDPILDALDTLWESLKPMISIIVGMLAPALHSVSKALAPVVHFLGFLGGVVLVGLAAIISVVANAITAFIRTLVIIADILTFGAFGLTGKFDTMMNSQDRHTDAMDSHAKALKDAGRFGGGKRTKQALNRYSYKRMMDQQERFAPG